VGDDCCSPDVGARIVQTACDVLLIDQIIFPLNLDFLNEVYASLPHLKVVMIGMDEDESVFLSSIRAGVTGYLMKDASADDVLTTIRAVMQGEAIFPPRLSTTLCKAFAGNVKADLNVTLTVRLGLTRRERELIPLIAQGLTNKEIAARLNLSEQTIKNHIHRVLHKVGTSDRMSAVEKVRSQCKDIHKYYA